MKRCFLCLAALEYVLAILLLSPAQAAQPAQWSPRGAGGGGALFAPSFNPFSAGELYMACDMSEVFRSTNYGAGWITTDFGQIQGGRNAMVQFTSDPKVFYSIDYSGDVMTPTKSVNGGITWQHLASDPTARRGIRVVSQIRVLRTDHGFGLYNLYCSTNGGANFASKFSAAGGLIGGRLFLMGKRLCGDEFGVAGVDE